MEDDERTICCPICGGTGEVGRSGTGPNDWSITCTLCQGDGTSTPKAHAEFEDRLARMADEAAERAYEARMEA